MPKEFFDVFPTLKVNDNLRGLLSQATVTRVTVTSARDRMRVYLESPRLLYWQSVQDTEHEIRRQIFGNASMDVKIIVKFQLSRQYTPRTLMQEYESSILSEIRDYNIFLYSILRQAECTFTADDEMTLTIEKNVIAEERLEELLQILEKIFCERCGMHFKVQTVFKEPVESKSHKNSELRIQQEVDAILQNAVLGNPEEPQNLPEENGQVESAKAEGKAEAAKKEKAKPEKKNDGKSEKKVEKQTADMPKSRGNFQGKGGFRSGFSRGDGPRSVRRSDNPDVLYGRDFESESLAIEQIQGEMGEVTIRGQVQTLETRDIRNNKTIIMMEVTDFTDTIVIKIFAQTEQVPEILKDIKTGAFLKIRGVTTIDRFDGQLSIGSVFGIKKIQDFRKQRVDTWLEKRVELHCHTKMSDMDGVSDVKDIINRAKSWGHKAIAITDHGVVQAFPDANHAVSPDEDFKIIYGCEAYLVDDLQDLVVNSRNQSLEDAYVVFDLETTGFSTVANKIIEIGAVKVVNGKITDKFSTFVNPEVPIPYRIEELTSINDNMVLDAPTIEEILPKFLEFSEGCVMVAHNASFDMGFIEANCKRQGIEKEFTVVDTVALARVLMPQLNRFKLDTVAKALKVSLENHHRAVDDAGCTAEIFVKFIEMLQQRDITTLDGVNELGRTSVDKIRKSPSHHAILLATNDLGRINLYRLVSCSHLKYYNRRPLIPKSEFVRHREGLLLGSACEAGELYQAVLNHRSDQEIARLVNFYDYLEIQPVGNNRFMIADDKHDMISSEEDLKEINRKIVKLGEQFKKPVVATCDVHFMDPQDEIYRRIIMAGNGFSDADEQAPLYLRTTEEMLEEFAYLGSEKAEEVVITNTNKIADMIEKISPIHPDKFPPVIENSDQDLKNICFTKAHEMYGDPLPEIVESRLDRELNSIISNGYAVMYIIAQKLVWKSNEDGYLVGSRGSVGSSLAATMSGITEVNPLPPHYLCPNPDCKYSDFDSPEVKQYAGMAGCDMPDKICPKCGTRMKKEGFDIPFETFLGFKGDKEPDIDLNFSGEYQANAHRYTEVIFGKGQTFKAGTIGTLAEKTAFGYVKNYFEERGVHKRYCEINRIVQGCTGVRRTTGQHPGGIIVLPVGEEIEKFTPVQHPANDVNSDIITTHFDYHSIDGNLLKLDILGHDDPTMIRMLEDLTGISARDVPLDQRDVMSLFASTKALKIEPEDIGGCKLGCLGIPEFGTDFAMQMLIDTKPKYFSDLIRIAGLSHGTDVWLGNAQVLIQEGKATISTAICTRDDIMIYLIGKGVESGLAFTIMESVRKGKGLRDEWIETMKEHGVPDWYIWSCKLIKYMFPKAHAAAYVMMAYRIAWYKVFQPLAYYAAYFSIRATAFSYEMMCMGKERLEYYMAEIRKKGDSASKKELDTLKDMRIVQEMYARGFEFVPIDLYTAKAQRFQIVDGKLMPSLATIDGLGDKAADAVVDAAKQGKFLSKDDFRDRTKVSKTVIDLMDDLKLFGDIPQSNQMSLFDFTG